MITPSFECIENDAEFLELEITTSCLDKKEADAEEHFKSTLESLPAIAQASSPASLSSNNKPNMPELNIVQHKDPIGNDEKGSAVIDATTFNYRKSLSAAFTQNGATQLNEDIRNRINNGDDGLLFNSSRRAEKLVEGYLENIKNEPTAEARRKETERSLLESPNEAVRASLFQWYQGKCQICGDTWPKRDGNPYFTAAYIVERQHKRWLDGPGNALCLCARHFAQWRLATKHATTEITEQIGNLKLNSEGGDGDLSIRFQLVDQNAVINFCERHALALRKLLDTEVENRLEK